MGVYKPLMHHYKGLMRISMQQNTWKVYVIYTEFFFKVKFWANIEQQVLQIYQQKTLGKNTRAFLEALMMSTVSKHFKGRLVLLTLVVTNHYFSPWQNIRFVHLLVQGQ